MAMGSKSRCRPVADRLTDVFIKGFEDRVKQVSVLSRLGEIEQ